MNREPLMLRWRTRLQVTEWGMSGFHQMRGCQCGNSLSMRESAHALCFGSAYAEVEASIYWGNGKNV